MMRIDNSMLADILSCSTRAWVKYVQHVQMRTQDSDLAHERMAVGTLFHKVFEHCLMRWEVGANLLWVAEEYQRVFPEGVSQEKYELTNLLVIAETWLQWASRYFQDYDVVSVEETLEMSLGEGVLFFGTPDAVLRDQYGLWIVDHKTTGWLSEEKKRFWARGSQGMGYWSLVTHRYGEEPRGILWNGLEIGKIPPWDGKMSKKCSKHGVQYFECQELHVNHVMVGPAVYTKEQLSLWRKNAQEGAAKFQHVCAIDVQDDLALLLDMEGRFTYPGCSQCPFTDWCWAGRPVAYMASMMEAYQWPVEALVDGGSLT